MKEGENLFVTDEGSKNGTIVNGLKVESVRLEDGDVIRIGDNLVIVVSVSSNDEARQKSDCAGRRGIRRKAQGIRHKEKIRFLLLFLPCALCLRP
jgi:pSer/pThr/pTyr-binding forkhead associated (FHA) protein